MRAQVEEAGRLKGAIGRLREDLGSQLEAEKKKGEKVGRKEHDSALRPASPPIIGPLPFH
jgi:hypothetical protein